MNGMGQENYTPMGKERQTQWEAIMKLGKMSKQTEVEHIARCLFEIEISLGQLSAYEEGLDKLLGLPYRSQWHLMGDDTQQWWVEKAKEYIKEQGLPLSG